MKKRTSVLLSSLLAAAALTAGFGTMNLMAGEAGYPSKDICIIVPFAAGGNTDLLARKMAELLPKYLPNEVNVYVENISEGGNVPGTTKVYNSEPDGYTIGFFGQGPMSTTPLTVETPYSHDSFTTIAQVASYAPSLAVAADSPYQTYDELLAAIKENPGMMAYASQSLAGAGNCAIQCMLEAEGLDLIHIPSGGDAASITELLGGHVDFIAGGPYRSYVESGELKVLAIMGNNPVDYLEEGSYVLFGDLGYETLGDSYSCVAGPAGIDPEIVKILDDAIEQLVQDEEFSGLISSMGLNPEFKNSEELQVIVSKLYNDTYELFKKLGVEMVVE